MLNAIVAASKQDERLAALLDEVREYAQIYLLAKQRHKGCAGTGELMTLKEEFRDVVDKMVRYCRENNHLHGDCEHDAETLAEKLVKKEDS